MKSATPRKAKPASGAIGSTQTAAEWMIYKGSTLMFDSGTDTTDLASLTVPTGKLTTGNTYNWKVRYEDNYGDWGTFSTNTTFATVAVPEPTSIGCLLAAGAMLFRRRRIAG